MTLWSRATSNELPTYISNQSEYFDFYAETFLPDLNSIRNTKVSLEKKHNVDAVF